MKSGIYAIINKVNGKRYIGSAIDLSKRWHAYHRCSLRAGTHQQKLQRAWNKYGESAFIYQTLLLCSKRNLLFYEQRAIDAYPWSDLYNICKVAGSPLGTKRTLEQRAAMSARQAGDESIAEHCKRMSMIAAAKSLGQKRPIEWRLNIASGLKGKKHPPERTALQLGNKRGVGKRSAEVRMNMSDGAKRRWAKYKGLIPAAGVSGDSTPEKRAIGAKNG